MSKKRDPFRVQTGARLAQIRVAMGFDTIRSFAKEMEVEEDRYDAWEKGKALIPPHEVVWLKTTYGVTADWLYFGDPSGLSLNLAAQLGVRDGLPVKKVRQQ